MSKGGEWTYTLYYTPDDRNLRPSPERFRHDDLPARFTSRSGPRIVNAWICKYSLGISAVPLFGFCHEFVIVKDSEDFYWSFEKDRKGISVQRCHDLTTARYTYRGENRTPFMVIDTGRDMLTGWEGDTIEDIFLWIHKMNYLNSTYDVLDDNCQYFASFLYEAIEHRSNRLHLGNYDSSEDDLTSTENGVDLQRELVSYPFGAIIGYNSLQEFLPHPFGSNVRFHFRRGTLQIQLIPPTRRFQPNP